MLRIVHITVVRNLSSGQEKQLRWEFEAAKYLNTAQWETLVFHDGPSSAPFVKRVPFFFRSLFLRNLYAWVFAFKVSRCNDFVLMRHITFDPFSFIFAPLIRNRITVHHAKDVEALRLVRRGWKGWSASFFERLSGRYSIRHALAILGVTHEISQYQLERAMVKKPVGVYPNGINLIQIKLLDDTRFANEIHIIFLCGKFSDWQGLDKLLKAVDEHSLEKIQIPVCIHLIGQLSALQDSDIQANKARRRIFKSYGLMAESEYRPILEQCDFGLASLAVEREGLREASTLKVREMLALGLPVYSSHEDLALDRSADFVKIVKDLKLSEMIEFGMRCKKIDRATIRKNSQNRIGKLCAMKSVIQFIENSLE